METKTIENNPTIDEQMNTMTFTYIPITSSQADSSLWNDITNRLNSLNRTQAESAKVATSDMKGKDARAVVIYCNLEAPREDNLGTTWRSKEFNTSSDYNDMYSECVNFLNSSNLSDSQKYHSRLTMTNASGHKSRLVLFYRELI
jgi:hypothetical protein